MLLFVQPEQVGSIDNESLVGWDMSPRSLGWGIPPPKCYCCCVGYTPPAGKVLLLLLRGGVTPPPRVLDAYC